MIALRPTEIPLPLRAAQAQGQRKITVEYTDEFRQLERRVAGARLGEGLPQLSVSQPPYGDLY